MGFLTDSRGNLSVFRVSIFIGIVGALLIGGGLLSFSLDQESRRQPFFIDTPPNAQTLGDENVIGPGQQYAYYRMPDGNIQNVVDFYDRQMRLHYGGSGEIAGEDCERFPRSGTYPDYIEEPGEVPFLYQCMFDRGGLNMEQWTLVSLFPRNPFDNENGYVVIEYEQRWTP